jgi:hypothetical protein
MSELVMPTVITAIANPEAEGFVAVNRRYFLELFTA